MDNLENTQFFRVKTENKMSAKEVLTTVYQSLVEKGYNPIDQMMGYLMSGDPTYITSYQNARSIIVKVDRDELVEELLKNYIKHNT